MRVTLDDGERDPRLARAIDARSRPDAAWFGVALMRVDYGPAASAAGAAGDAHDEAHAEEGRCVAGRITRSSLSAPPQCEQTMGLGAGASISVLTGLAANPCAISTCSHLLEGHAEAGREKSVVAHLHESWWEHVLQKAADEFGNGQDHGSPT